MILYEDDWKRFPDAIADFNTTNRSFVKMAKLYKRMGIRNHTFMLALHNPELQGVDPHSPDLTVAQMLAIGVECKVNPWYYFREVGRAQPIAGGDPVPHEANRGNMAFYWCFFNHVVIMRIQIRQTGKSFDSDDLATYLLNIGCSSTQINLLTKDDRLRTENLARLKDMINDLPPYLKRLKPSDVANTEEIRISENGNKFIGHVPQASPKAALSKARGLTSPIFFVDEPPFQPNIEISLSAALSAGGAARDAARKNGEHYGTVLTTTAGKIDDRDGKYVYRFLKEMAVWSDYYFDCPTPKDFEEVIRKSSRSAAQESKLFEDGQGGGQFRVNITMNHRQLGKTDEWLKLKLEESASTGDAADRDYFNRWTSGSQRSPFSTEVTEKIKRSEFADYYAERQPNNFVVRWMIPKETIDEVMNDPGAHFILAVDPSEGGGGDDLSFLLIDIRDGGIVAAANMNEINIITFSNWLATWFVDYSNITGIIERRSSGPSIIDALILILSSKGIDPFKRLFNWVVNDKDEKPDRFAECVSMASRKRMEVYEQQKRTFGFATSGNGETSRDGLYGPVLKTAIKMCGDKIRDPITVEQILSLEEKNERIDHPSGGHDDMVIAWLLGMWMLSRGKNLSHYGIDKRIIMSRSKEIELQTPTERYNYASQLKIRREMEDIAERLHNERDELIAERLEARLKMLSTSLVLDETEDFSIDVLINDLRAERRERMKNRQPSSILDRGMQTRNPVYDVREMHSRASGFYYS